MMCAGPIEIIGAVFLLSFSILTLFAGAFTLYFGAGKTRKIGAVLLIIGIAIIGLYSYVLLADVEGFFFEDVNIFDAAMVVIGVILGAILAAGVFLIAIIKS